MKRPAIIIIILIWMGSCTGKSAFQKDRQSFEASKTLFSFKSVADMNDSYFIIKENNFFEFYKILYDSVKNSSYPGKYLTNGDTIILNFYNRKGYTLLGKKALIDKNKKEIVFFDNFPGVRKKLLVN